jgi:hypothetical protein
VIVDVTVRLGGGVVGELEGSGDGVEVVVSLGVGVGDLVGRGDGAVVAVWLAVGEGDAVALDVGLLVIVIVGDDVAVGSGVGDCEIAGVPVRSGRVVVSISGDATVEIGVAALTGLDSPPFRGSGDGDACGAGVLACAIGLPVIGDAAVTDGLLTWPGGGATTRGVSVASGVAFAALVGSTIPMTGEPSGCGEADRVACRSVAT